jgi:hypothetical protein
VVATAIARHERAAAATDGEERAEDESAPDQFRQICSWVHVAALVARVDSRHRKIV